MSKKPKAFTDADRLKVFEALSSKTGAAQRDPATGKPAQFAGPRRVVITSPDGVEHRNNNYDIIFDATGITVGHKNQAIKKLNAVEIKEGIRELFRLSNLDVDQKRLVLKQVDDELTRHAHNLPEKAPILYADRADRKENPVEFIKRVYAPWIGNGLDRPAILRLDKQLYNGLNQWRLRHGPDDLALPTKSETVAREVAQAEPAVFREANRLHKAAYLQRKRIQKTP